MGRIGKRHPSVSDIHVMQAADQDPVRATGRGCGTRAGWYEPRPVADTLLLIGVLVAWLVLTRWILPRLGVPA
jgi:hypothetical protein